MYLAATDFAEGPMRLGLDSRRTVLERDSPSDRQTRRSGDAQHAERQVVDEYVVDRKVNRRVPRRKRVGIRIGDQRV